MILMILLIFSSLPQCSVECGQGVTHRKLVCGHVVSDTFKSLPDHACAHLPEPPRRAGCSEQACTAQWYTTDWSQVISNELLFILHGDTKVYTYNSQLTGVPTYYCLNVT
jgi:hypothetical protein